MNTIFKAFALTALAATAATGPVYAQESAHRADSSNSVGRIFLTSTKRPQLQNNIAVTRVSGNIVEGPANAPSAVSFTLYPADQNSDAAEKTDSTIVKFQSHNIQKIHDQTYRASGQLTVTYVVQIATTGPSESYSGPTYSQAATYSVNHDATAELQPVYHPGSNGAAGYTDWNVKTSVAGHSFPELLVAVSSTSWPEYRNNEQCTMPANVGEDFSGPTCTADVITTAARTDVQCGIPANPGEDFSGAVCTGTPLVTPSTREQVRNSVQIVEASNTDSVVADEVLIALNLRINGNSFSLAGNSGK
jgi:hypothetical protein